MLGPLAGACALALALSGPGRPALLLAAVHALEDGHAHAHVDDSHRHEHDSDHQHELIQADAQPAAPMASVQLAPSKQDLGRFVAADIRNAGTLPAAALSMFFDAGPPTAAVGLHFSRTPSDRAPPA